MGYYSNTITPKEKAFCEVIKRKIQKRIQSFSIKKQENLNGKRYKSQAFYSYYAAFCLV